MTREPAGDEAREVAHDIGNLLTALIGAADAILERTGIDSETHADAAHIREAARGGAGLLRRLRDGRSRESELISINATIRSISRLLAHSLGPTITLRLDLDAPDAEVRFDRSQLHRMLLNLIVNAHHAMSDGGTVVLSTARQSVDVEQHRIPDSIPSGDYTVIAVVDTGVGVPRDLLSDIFQPGVTSRRATGGSGLGLASVRDIARQSGGFLTVESNEGRGTRFEIWLPCDEIAPAPISVQPATAPGSVLLVEDDVLVRQVAERVLQRSGWTVRCVGSAEDALQMLKHMHCDLMISDVALPGMDGLALARHVQKLCGDLPIILTSGYERAATGAGLETSDFVFLTKPYAQEDLLAAVARAARIQAVAKNPMRQECAPVEQS
jgi:two-component system cell cycle sensor histidine kinase/response regulator CckA